MRFGLDRMRRMMTVLGSPERRFASIHVVGTNGKSSTTRMIAAILERHGLRTGAYLSPHLVSYTERVRVGERDLSMHAFAAAVARAAWAAERVNRTLAEDDHVTQFELLTAAAFWALAERGVEVAVVEAGLGALRRDVGDRVRGDGAEQRRAGAHALAGRRCATSRPRSLRWCGRAARSRWAPTSIPWRWRWPRRWRASVRLASCGRRSGSTRRDRRAGPSSVATSRSRARRPRRTWPRRGSPCARRRCAARPSRWSSRGACRCSARTR